MSKVTNNLDKLADKFEWKLKKLAQMNEAVPLQDKEQPKQEAFYLEDLLDKLFLNAERNKIMTDIYNGATFEGDINSIQTAVAIKDKTVIGSVFVNGSQSTDPGGSKILTTALAAKIKEPDLTNYNGTFIKSWMHYPK
jgi:hypothetical protein